MLPAETRRKGLSGETQAEAGDERAPDVSFIAHVFHMASQAAMALGEIESPLTGKRETDLRSARFLIDIIEILEEKTRGNLDDDETRYINGVLADLRMKYVQKSG